MTDNPDLARAIYGTLAEISRRLADANQLQRQTLTTLQDINRELEYLRTERRRMERIESQVAQLTEADDEFRRRQQLLDDAADVLKKVSGGE